MASRKKSPATQGRPVRTAVVVLGMHRSGTSAMAGVLGQMGCDLPQDLMGPAEINAKGFFESNKVTGLNEELLASAGFRWFSFPRFPVTWFASPKAAEFLERAGTVIAEEYGRSHLFTLKDPRICRLLPFWQRALDDAGCRTAYVCIHRHPQDVAASLTRWANYQNDYGLLLWLRHVLDAEAESRGQLRVFTSYDRLMADWVGTVNAIGKGFNLIWPRSTETAAAGVEDFLTAELQHFSHARAEGRRGDSLPDWVAETYAILESWAASGERASDHKQLDRIRGALDDASPTFAGLILRGQEHWLKMQHLQQHIDNLEGPVRQAQQAALQQARAETVAQVAELTEAVNQALAASAAHAAHHRTEQQNRAAAEAQAAELQALLDHARAEAASHAANHLTEQQIRAAAEAQVAALAADLAAARSETAPDATVVEAEARVQADLEAPAAQMLDALTQARVETEGRIAGLSQALDQVQTDKHTANAETERLLAEAREAAQDLLAQLAQEEEALQSLQDAKAALEEDLRRSEELRLTAEHEASQLRSALIQRGQEADDLHQQNAEDAQRLAELDAALEAARRDHAELTRQDERNTKHLEILTKRVTEQLRQDLESRLTPPVDADAIAREHRALIEDYEARLTYNRKTRAAAEADLARVEAEKAALASEADALREQVAKRGHEIHALKQRLEKGQSELDALSAKLAGADAQTQTATAALKAKVLQLQADRQNLTSTAEALQGKLDAAARSEADLQGRLRDRQQEVAQTRSALAKLSEEVARGKAEAEARVKTLTSKVQTLETDRQALKRTADGLSGKLEKAEKKEEQLQTQLNDRLEIVRQTREDLAVLTKEHRSTLRRVALLRDERKAYEARLRGLEAEVDGLMGSLSWRITGPMRALSGIMRRVVPGERDKDLQ